jgi:hypothetical protein
MVVRGSGGGAAAALALTVAAPAASAGGDGCPPIRPASSAARTILTPPWSRTATATSVSTSGTAKGPLRHDQHKPPRVAVTGSVRQSHLACQHPVVLAGDTRRQADEVEAPEPVCHRGSLASRIIAPASAIHLSSVVTTRKREWSSSHCLPRQRQLRTAVVENASARVTPPPETRQTTRLPNKPSDRRLGRLSVVMAA